VYGYFFVDGSVEFTLKLYQPRKISCLQFLVPDSIALPKNTRLTMGEAKIFKVL
jgi:hypothetical protein